MKRGGKHQKAKRPFWLPASTYYLFSATITVGIFLVVWLILNAGPDESPWISAGIVATAAMTCAVLVREVILQNRRRRIVLAQRRLDNSLLSVPLPSSRSTDPEKLTLERNAALVEDIRRKSDAAKVLTKFSESHREVFELCDAYLEAVRRELPLVRVGSPRLGPITRGRDMAERTHKFHMLKWAESEARSHTHAAARAEDVTVRRDLAQKALEAVETALRYYPEEKKLNESRNVLEQVLESIFSADMAGRGSETDESGNVERARPSEIEPEEAIDTLIDLDLEQVTERHGNASSI